LKLELAQFLELEQFLEFIEEVDPETRKRLERGRRVREILKQKRMFPLPFEKEVVAIYTAVEGFLDEVKLEDIAKFEEELFKTIEVEKGEIFEKIRKSGEFDSAVKSELDKIIHFLVKKYAPKGD